MKKYILSYLLILCISIAHAQEMDWRLSLKDEYYKKYASRGLQVGDRAPEISLQYAVNNKTGKNKLSDFKGKLIILDFWATNCSVCIHDFPKMEALQKKFNDKIQIFLVNLSESQEEIEHAKTMAYFKGTVFPDLPSIVANPGKLDRSHLIESIYKRTPVKHYFPSHQVPYHIWIDQNGIIRVMGGHENTNEKSIENFLKGKPGYFSRSPNNTPELGRQDISYQKLIAVMKPAPITRMSSIVTPYNREISPNPFGKSLNDVVDSVSKTVRTTFLNSPLLTIYISGFYLPKYGTDILNKQILIGPYGREKDFVEFSTGVDTTLYTDEYKEENTTEVFPRSNYCYEQILPINASKEDRRKYLFEDLNKFSALQFGCIADIVQKSIPVYYLRRTSDFDKLESHDKVNRAGKMVEDKSTLNTLSIKNYTLESAIKYGLGPRGLTELLMINKNQSKPFLLLNATGWPVSKSVDISFPLVGVHSFEELNKALAPYDLVVEQGTTEFNFIVFRNINKQ